MTGRRRPIELLERYQAAGWPASPNGNGLHVTCPECGKATVTVIMQAGEVALQGGCSTGCATDTTWRKLALIHDARRADHEPVPRAALDTSGLRIKDRIKQTLTDAGNAKRFVIDWEGEVHYVIGAGWQVWDGRRWRTDDDGAAHRRAIVTAEHIRKLEAAHLRDETEAVADDQALDDADRKRKMAAAEKSAHARAKWALQSENAARLRAMLELARSDARLVVSPDDLDADPYLLNVGTGTLDLRTGDLRPHRREDRLTRLVPIAYDPDATCPRFDAFRAEVLQGDDELDAYLQRAVGYTLTGDTREQVLFVLHGDGANGKTTLLNALIGMLGDHARSADSKTFTTAGADRAARSDLARLRGCRLVVASEIPRGATLDEDLIKRITGGERIAARFNRQDEFEYTPDFKLWLAVNHLPSVAGSDHAIWRRLRVVPFRHRVAKVDQDLGRKLHAELPGILAWAVRGALDWQRDGLGTCAAVDEATDAYRAEQDHVARFLDERCVFEPLAKVTNGELHSAYVAWCDAHSQTPMTPEALGHELSKRSIAVGKSNGQRVRKGVRLK